MSPTKNAKPVWPYMGIVACLFVLAVLAPSPWRSLQVSDEITPDVRLPSPSRGVTPLPEEAAPNHHTADSQLPISTPGSPEWNAPTESLAPEPATLPSAANAAKPYVETGAPKPRQNEPRQPAGESELETTDTETTGTETTDTGLHLAPIAKRTELGEHTGSPQRAAIAPLVGNRIMSNTPTDTVPSVVAPKDDAAPEPTLQIDEAETGNRTDIEPQRSETYKPIIEVDANGVENPVDATDSEPTLSRPPPSDETRTPDPAPKVTRVWPLAESLIQHLEVLGASGETDVWAIRAINLLRQLHETPTLESHTAAPLLDQLEAVSAEARDLAASVSNSGLRQGLLRAAYSIQRRIVVWRQIHGIKINNVYAVSITDVRPWDMADELRAVELSLSRQRHQQSWRDYLLLETVSDAVAASDVETRRSVSRSVLRRMHSTQLTDGVRSMFGQSPFVEFAWVLRSWANEPVDFSGLLADLEKFESDPSAANARTMANHYDEMRWSRSRTVSDLAETVNLHYRNANVRVAISENLINRLLPTQGEVDQDVRETILGAWVYGTSRTSNQLRVTLEPDPRRWRFGFEARGRVDSETSASIGPARFFNNGRSRFRARKLLMVDRNGVRSRSAEAEASSSTDLMGLYTDYDSIPVVGWLVRTYALQQHNDQYYRAQRVAAARVEDEAVSRLDEEVQDYVESAKDEFRVKVLQPLRKLQLEPVALEMRTTPDRLISRLRLAGDDQMASFTPRPQALNNSLLSVQVHETTLANTLGKLELDGKKTELRAFYREVADTFKQPDYVVPDDIPDDVTLRFASQDPIRVRCEKGLVTITIGIAELKSGRQRWKNFAVRAFYAPDASDLRGKLVRDGVVQLAGQRLRTGDQIALRLIFSTVFSKNRPINLISPRLADHPSLEDLQITQFVIDDGWVGIALGPKADPVIRNASRPVPVVRR